MDVFDLRDRLVSDYSSYTTSFIKISDTRIKDAVDSALAAGMLWPEPLLQLNPTFLPGGTIDDLVDGGVLHEECRRIFRIGKSAGDPVGKSLVLHTHQKEAILKAKEQKSYVLTSGTGSGKSLTYIIPIVDHILREGSGGGIKAIVVYPMNALANSQNDELKKFLCHGYSEANMPVKFSRYTGQEKQDEREAIRKHPPDILLTNYMMLELLLTRVEDRDLVRAALGLKFLVFDELHTYRGRQGADVAMLIRRCKMAFGNKNVICIGTSATMASGGNSFDQKKEVAKVAQTLFGTEFDSSQVIGETLERATAELDETNPDILKELKETVTSDKEPPSDFTSFSSHPLASWIESQFGVTTETETGLLVRQRPQRLSGPHSASEKLAFLTSADPERCAQVLRDFLNKGAELRRSESSRFPIFAFRLHQFFTRGDTVWASIEPSDVRHLEMSKMTAKPGEPEKPLYPLTFCRACGKEYYRVLIKSKADGRGISARDGRGVDSDVETAEGFLYVSETNPWPAKGSNEELNRVPSAMKETIADGSERIIPDQRKDLPEPVWVAPTGKIVPEGEGISGALIFHNFYFCLEPGCRVTYSKVQRSERLKLSTLGVDSRSTATTVLALRALSELRADEALQREARKLLSFTDNRQDASLQAGHFNDFAQVALLRSALYRAAKAKDRDGLSHHELSRSVFHEMDLDFGEYAADPDLRGPARSATHDALRRVIEYHLYRDLKRGWRVTAPNLEECGLLNFDYLGLDGDDGLLSETELWESGFEVTEDRRQKVFVETPPTLSSCLAEVRKEVIITLLDVLRRGLAVKADVLDHSKQLDLIQQTNNRLQEGTVWYLNDTRELEKAVVAYPTTKTRGTDRLGLYVSSYGGFGKYLSRVLKQHRQPGTAVSREDIDAAINFLFLALQRYGILAQVRSGDTSGFQINPDALLWTAGEGEIKPIDKTRLIEAGEMPPEPNSYFVNCYKHFLDLKQALEAREHTAQVSAEDRQDREDRFRSGELPLLFCSPTMELGVDISQLNVVNMRNVPPTPANYAQRSGRAGRGGQPALVYTYCAGQSPHDQYYYHQPEDMVSGSVVAPRIDLTNRDLLKTHLHAVWMEVAKPDLGKTLMSVIDIKKEDGKISLPVKKALQDTLRNPKYKLDAFEKASELIGGLKDELERAAWFHPDWTKSVLDQLEREFETACERWRTLYRAAEYQRELHHKIIGDHSRGESERNHSRQLRAQAENQIRLLTEAEGVYEGDFYSYRYFAAEGFLPGYNFPRLPISAFVPARRRARGKDEFVSRPRFLAISEFGPRALIYHEGARYRVYKVNLDFGTDEIERTHSLATATVKRCGSCGYAHFEEGVRFDEKCERCGQTLDEKTKISSLVHLQNVTLKLAERITCDEEERQRFGYKLVTSYRFPEVGGRLDRKDAEVKSGTSTLMRVSYGDAASLYRINLGWSNQRANEQPGFLLDLERGYWARNQADAEDQEDPTSGRMLRVVPFVTDTKNALVMRLDPPREVAVVAALQAAFKEAIQKYFQLEPRELVAEAMPSSGERQEILFYEASEGGAGVLRQLVDDPKVIPALARTALEICHFDPDTLDDLREHRCGKACYECLLDYFNQPDHSILDRNLIKDILAQLAGAECKPAGGTGTRQERMVFLRNQCDSQLEKSWLDMIERLNLRLPSDAQYLIEKCSTRPDFYYSDYKAAIYIDGPVHDTPEQRLKDEEINFALDERGIAVIRFHHEDDWEEILRRHPDVFGA